MTTLLTFVLIPAVILSILVLIHELGHFYAAKKAGVLVEEFGIGLPPRIFGKKFGETLYSVNLLPFGGFVKLFGEDESDEAPTQDVLTNSRSFASKSPLQRGIILVAGVTMNFLLAIVLYYVFFVSTGFRTFSLPLFFDYDFRFGQQNIAHTVVMATEEGSPAEQLGIRPGEAIVEIEGTPIRNFSDVRTTLMDKAGEEVNVTLVNMTSFNRDLRTIQAVPVENDQGDGVLGVFLGSTVSLDYSDQKYLSGPMHSYNMLAYSGFVFSKFVQESFSQRNLEPVSAGVAGPVGIFATIGNIVNQSETPLLGLIDLTALLSISLALINILPLPALDGGRLVFVFVEGISGKKVSPSFELAAHKVGMLLLLLLIVLVTIRDITRLF